MTEEYTKFFNESDKLRFMKKYGLASKTASNIPKLYHKLLHEHAYKKCDLLGYAEEYDTWCIMVIDYGKGPVRIHSDFFLDMQTLERKKGNSLKNYVDTFVVFDFETTGINLKECEIIQIGAIKFENGIEIDTFNEYVRPENPIPSKITALTGITDLDVCMADDIEVVLKRFLNFIGNNVLVGYNISSFDTTLLYDHAKHIYGIDVSNDYIDLRYIAESYFKRKKINIENHKLSTVANYFGIDTQNAHRALADCYITYECYNKIFEKNTMVTTKINNVTNKLEQEILDMLQEIIVTEELPDNCLYLSSNMSRAGVNKGQEKSKSICVHEPEYPPNINSTDTLGKNDTFAQMVYEKDSKIKIKVKAKYLRYISVPSGVQVKAETNGLYSNIYFENDSSDICNFIKSVVLVGLKLYESSSSFSCCSQFTRCSDEKKCVHINKLYSKGCKYRSNLEAGRIFYGKNRNID